MNHKRVSSKGICRRLVGCCLWISFFTGLMILTGVLAGCSGSVWKEETRTEQDNTDPEDSMEAQQNSVEEQTEQIEAADAASFAQTEDAQAKADKEQTAAEETRIYVDVCGQVTNPGVYALPAGSRVYEAVNLAGGFTDQAAPACINQADVLQDGQQIYVYSLEEAAAQRVSAPAVKTAETEVAVSEGKVDLNHADKAALMTLTGIGETRAEAILAYRREHGSFSSPEELMKVDGIKEKTYDKLKDEIMVTAM